MAQQNIYDNEIFFDGYRKIREREDNANILFEMPAFYSLLPKLSGKSVLDLGCGFGEHCARFVQNGAKKVVGIDISEKMLQVAKRENADPAITYYHMAMEHISDIEGYYDVITSSLAFHYVEDFGKLMADCFDLLKPGGTLVFSQEHPLTSTFGTGEALDTAPKERWTKDENGRKLYLNLSYYGVEGERESTWFVDNVKKYHRTFSTILNTLTDTGFVVEKIIEPMPTPEILKDHPEQADLYHKPDFLLVKAVKPASAYNF